MFIVWLAIFFCVSSIWWCSGGYFGSYYQDHFRGRGVWFCQWREQCYYFQRYTYIRNNYQAEVHYIPSTVWNVVSFIGVTAKDYFSFNPQHNIICLYRSCSFWWHSCQESTHHTSTVDGCLLHHCGSRSSLCSRLSPFHYNFQEEEVRTNIHLGANNTN